ncbi:alpha-galactosidase [Arachidicoccus terrestris]|uniref:alpha-galactosidase n=1 Tax=Arachidicoccus terrestris TaxID=2875539 RepID=UPI001CC57D80|nr:alpha-galactosidase [Arachidicoccus terrestris]
MINIPSGKGTKLRMFVFLSVLISIFFYSTTKAQVIPIETDSSAMVLFVTKNKEVRLRYFGQKLNDVKEYEQFTGQLHQASDPSGVADAVYSSAGSRNFFEPAISVIHADGNTSLALRYVSSDVKRISADIEETQLLLKDPVYDFNVKLVFRAYRKDNVVEQWSEITQNENGAVRLNKFASANLYWYGSSFWLKQYHGDWAREMQPEVTKLSHGIKTLDTKLGTRADLFQPPVFIISADHKPMEDQGEVMLGSIEWSGNYRVDLEVDNRNNLRIIAGMNNASSSYELQPGKTFRTPRFLYTLSQQGTGQASRNLQSWARKYRILDGEGGRLTLLNNWESTYFDFNEEKLKNLLGDTKKLGVDLFLLDDGWFANKYPRNDDHAGLGDWQPNRKKLPNGIQAVVKDADKKGVKFGIWIEPEMVNPKSELYEKHPDWVIKQPDRPEYYFRNQLVLDLSNPKVQDFVFGIVDSLFIKNPSLAYIKWDCNSVIYNAYSAHLNHQSELYIAYVRGLYKVLERIRAKYPQVPMMLCSGGGGRVDYAALKYFTEFWPSDNTDPLERVFMQWEYSYFYPAISMAAHVTNWGRQPIKYKVDVAMMGKLGFDIPVSKLKPEELSFCQQAVQQYNKVKDVIWHGDQYRLISPWNHDFASLMYVDRKKDKAVIFSYLVSNRYDAGSELPVKFKGLNPDQRYKIEEVNLYNGAKSSINDKKDNTYSGSFLMKAGFNPVVNSRRASVVLVATAVN